MKKKEDNAFSTWSFDSFLSEKEAEDAILDAISGKLTLPSGYKIAPIVNYIDLGQIIAAKQFSKSMGRACRVNRKLPSELVEEIVRTFFRDFNLNGVYRDKGPDIAHEAVKNLLKTGKIRVGIVQECGDQCRWAIISTDTLPDLSVSTVLPENPMWDDRIIEIIYGYKFVYRGDTLSPDELSEILKKGLEVNQSIPNSELIILINRLIRRDMLYLETRPFSNWRYNFSIQVTKRIKEKLKKAYKNANKNRV